MRAYNLRVKLTYERPLIYNKKVAIVFDCNVKQNTQT